MTRDARTLAAAGLSLAVAPIALAADTPAHPPVLPGADVPIVAWAMRISLIILAVALVMTVARVLRGPSVPDRVIGVDVLGNVAAGAIAIATISTGIPILLAVGLVISLIIFLGTAAFSLYLERRARP
ncbi:MAG: monovalent cation/H+ antiporter complex subunit F [Planctomycetota bacterium]